MTYSFQHRARIVKVRLASSEDEAKVRFQWSYGYWPSDPVKIEEDEV